MSATEKYPKVSDEGFLSSTYTETGKVLTAAAAATAALCSNSLVLDQYILWVSSLFWSQVSHLQQIYIYIYI